MTQRPITDNELQQLRNRITGFTGDARIAVSVRAVHAILQRIEELKKAAVPKPIMDFDIPAITPRGPIPTVFGGPPITPDSGVYIGIANTDPSTVAALSELEVALADLDLDDRPDKTALEMGRDWTDPPCDTELGDYPPQRTATPYRPYDDGDAL